LIHAGQVSLAVLRIRIRDPGVTTQIIFSRAWKPFFGIKILKFFDGDPGSGMKRIRIRDPGWKKLVSGINIPDPQQCSLWYALHTFTVLRWTLTNSSKIAFLLGL
jgi:hypothetical protein